MTILFKSAALTLALGLISACSSYVQQPSWYKEGASQQLTIDQLGYCRKDVGAEGLPAEQAERLIAYCMKSEGYIFHTEAEKKQRTKTQPNLNQNSNQNINFIED